MYWHPPYKCFGKFVFVFPAPVVCRKENKKTFVNGVNSRNKNRSYYVTTSHQPQYHMSTLIK